MCTAIEEEGEQRASVAGYSGPLVIESCDPGSEELSRLRAIWRKFADSGEILLIKGLRDLKVIASEVERRA